MGWTYERWIVYGTKIKSRNVHGLKEFLDKHSNIIKYNDDIVLKGEILVYPTTSYCLIHSDEGSYRSGRLDTCGDAFNEPSHPVFTKIRSDKSPHIFTQEETKTFNDLKQLCNITDLNFQWIEHAEVDY